MAKELNTLSPKKWIADYSGLAPTIGASDGVSIGDIAIDSNVSFDTFEWICLDNTDGAEIWKDRTHTVITTGTPVNNQLAVFTAVDTAEGDPDLTWDGSSLKVAGDIVLPKTTNTGLKVDPSAPTFGWKDLIGQIEPKVGGGTAPALTAFRGTNIKNYAFQTNDVIDLITFHIPHDYVPGTDVFLHHHWGHNGTAISGTFEVTYYVTYCKGYNQASQTFNSEITIVESVSTPNITAFPQWNHNIQEFQVSSSGGSGGTLLDTDLLEIDGLVQASLITTTIPTITGSATSDLPYIFMVDLHYQSNSMPTKDKNLPFYV